MFEKARRFTFNFADVGLGADMPFYIDERVCPNPKSSWGKPQLRRGKHDGSSVGNEMNRFSHAKRKY